MVQFTTTQLAKTNNISHDAASSLIGYLKVAGLIEKVGMQPRPEHQKGRGETIYQGDSAVVVKSLAKLKL